MDNEKVKALLAEPALNGDSRLTVAPGRLVGNLVALAGRGALACPVVMQKRRLQTRGASYELNVVQCYGRYWTFDTPTELANLSEWWPGPESDFEQVSCTGSQFCGLAVIEVNKGCKKSKLHNFYEKMMKQND